MTQNLYNMNDVRCPICSNTQILKKEYTGKYAQVNIQSLKHYSMFSCQQCSSEFAWPRQSQDYESVSTRLKGYKSFINKDEFEGQIHHTINCTSHWKDSSIIYNMLSDLKFRGEFLDFAAGSGYMTALANRLGYNVHALEINSDFQKFIKEMIPTAIIDESLEKLILSNKKFDVINAMHILEHVPDPVDVLTKFHSLLSPHGIIIVTVPNLDRAFYRFGERGKEIEDQIESLGFAGDFPPNHLTRFRSKTLNIAFQKGGFKSNVISYSPISVWDLFHHGLGDSRFKFKNYSTDITQMNIISSFEQRLNEMLSYLHLEYLGNSLIAISSNEMDQNQMEDLLTQCRIKVMNTYTATIHKEYDHFIHSEKTRDEMIIEKDRYIHSLKEQIDKHVTNIYEMHAEATFTVKEKDSYIESLSANLQGKDIYIGTLSANLQEKDIYIGTLSANLREKDIYIGTLSANLQEKEKYNKSLIERQESLLTELNSIKKNIFYRIIEKMSLIGK